jgi:hypothetical protein
MWLKRRDIFGERISLSYKGDEMHRTVLSALVSVGFKAVMLYFIAATICIAW